MGLEEKLSEILNNPESMAQILSMAQSLGMEPPGPQEPRKEPEARKEPKPDGPPPVDPAMLQGVLQLMEQVRHKDGKQEALLLALKPYLAPERRDKIDQALQIARISHLAGAALRNYGGIFGKQGR